MRFVSAAALGLAGALLFSACSSDPEKAGDECDPEDDACPGLLSCDATSKVCVPHEYGCSRDSGLYITEACATHCARRGFGFCAIGNDGPECVCLDCDECTGLGDYICYAEGYCRCNGCEPP